MEIQDRNSLLATMFGLKADVNSMLASTQDGFADILKSQQQESVSNAEKPVELKVERSFKDKTAIKQKEELPAQKESKKEDKKTAESKDDSSSSSQNINDKDNNTTAKEDKTSSANEVKQKDEAASGAQNKEGEEVKSSEEVGNETEVVEGEELSLDDVVIAPVAINLPVVEVVDDVQAVVTEDVVAMVDDSPKIEVEATEMFVEERVADEKLVKADAVKAKVENDVQLLTEEDALLVEQAKMLDEKIGTDKRIKIEVDVKEAKIADAVTKDIIQNRFEVDSLFQSVDVDAVMSEDNIDVLPTDVETVSQGEKTLINASLDNNKAVAFVETTASKDAVVKAVASDANDLSVSGKEVVFENANISKSETFAKLNETASRDAFKGMGKEVVEQIKVNITKSAVKGIDTIDIQLKPEDLGKIQIKMHIAKDGKLHADIISSRPETMDMLQKDVSSLAKAFSDAGYDTDSRSFSFSFQNENQAREQQKDDSGLLKFIGDTLEQEAESMAGNDNLGYDPILGLNIRV